MWMLGGVRSFLNAFSVFFSFCGLSIFGGIKDNFILGFLFCFSHTFNASEILAPKPQKMHLKVVKTI